MPHPNAIYWRSLWLICAGCVLTIMPLVLIDRWTWLHMILEGIVLGTVFTQTMMAATWSAFGPGKLPFRVPLSLAWAALLGNALALGVLVIGDHPDVPIFVFVTLALWIAAQVPLWGTAIFFGLRLWHQGTMPTVAEQRQGQFGIGQLMCFTALIAVVLGCARLVLSTSYFSGRDELTFWSFAIFSQIATNLPLICAMFLPRHYRTGIAVGLLLIVGVTALQAFFSPGVLGPPSYSYHAWLFGFTNLISVIWLLTFAALVRYSGYHFGKPQATSEPATDPSPSNTHP